LQASTHISDLVKKALSNNFSAVGLVDLGNMMGAFKFVSEVEKANANIKKTHKEFEEKKIKAQEEGQQFSDPEPRKEMLIPVIGCEFYISDRPEQKQFTEDDPD